MQSELEEEFQKWVKQYGQWSNYYSGDTIAKFREIFYAGAKAQESLAEKLGIRLKGEK